MAQPGTSALDNFQGRGTPLFEHPQFTPTHSQPQIAPAFNSRYVPFPIPSLYSQKRDFLLLNSYMSRLIDGETALLCPLSWSAKRVRDMDQEDDDFSSPLQPDSPLSSNLPPKPSFAPPAKPLIPSSSFSMSKANHHYFSPEELEEISKTEERLVPIRIDLDIGEQKLHDAFMWNLNEKYLTPERFAELLCNDLGIGVNYKISIGNIITKQLQDHEEFFEFDYSEVDSKVDIKLNLQVGKVLLRDQFEWDLYCIDNSPEEFAKILAADLGIGGEYVNLIAHSIHEQLLQHKKERLGSVLGDDSSHSRRQKLRYLHDDIRSLYRYGEEALDWAPTLEGLTQSQIEKLLIDRERSARRFRRETSRFSQSFKRSTRSFSPYSVQASSPLVQNLDFFSPPNSPARRSRLRQGNAASPALSASSPVMNEEDYKNWKCRHCGTSSGSTPLFRKGPDGQKTLCNACGLSWTVHGKLPENRRDMYR